MILKTIEEIYIDTNAWNGKEPIYAEMIVNLKQHHTMEIWKSGYLFFADNEVEEISYRSFGLVGYTLVFSRER